MGNEQREEGYVREERYESVMHLCGKDMDGGAQSWSIFGRVCSMPACLRMTLICVVLLSAGWGPGRAGAGDRGWRSGRRLAPRVDAAEAEERRGRGPVRGDEAREAGEE